jgi:Sulfotransferase family
MAPDRAANRVAAPAYNSRPTVPNFLVVGAGKAGTTALYHYLRTHPQIYMSPIKEPCYFSTDIRPENFHPTYRRSYLADYREYLRGDMSEPVHVAYVRTWEDYLALFRNASGEAAIGEISNTYLFSACAAQEIKTRLPQARIVMILRDPVARAWSHYQMDLRLGYAARSFSEELAQDFRRPAKGWGQSRLYLEQGLYFEQVKRYLAIFPRSQVFIMFAEEMRTNLPGALSKLYRFLDVAPDFAPPKPPSANEAALPRWVGVNYIARRSGLVELAGKILPSAIKRRLSRTLYVRSTARLAEADKNLLVALFRDDVRQLQDLIGRDLSSWLR